VAQWAAFVGLTGVLVLSMLALARLSQRAIDGEEGVAEAGIASAGPDDVAGNRLDGEPGSAFDDGAGPATVDPADGRPGHDPSTVNPATTDPRLPRFESVHRHAVRTGDGYRGPEGLSTGALLANVALTQGLFGALVVGAAVYFEIPAGAFGIGPTSTGPAALGIGVALGVVLWIATEIVGSMADAAGVGYDETLRGMLAPDSRGGWLLLLGAILPTVAVVEELVFRGAAVGAVVAGFGTPAWAAVLVSSLAFGVAHGAQGRVGMVLATALGLALAGAFVATETLLVVVVAHYLVNALEFVVHEGLGIDPLGSP